MKLIIHAGTGTIINADDDVFVLDTKRLTEDELALIDNEHDAVDLAKSKGRRLTKDALDITPSNSMVFTPMSIRYEVEMNEALVEENLAAWVLNQATEDDLWHISNVAILDELLWTNFADVLGGAIEEVYKRKDKS